MTKDEARANLRRAAAARRRAEAALERAREATQTALIAAWELDVRPTDLVTDSEYDREHVRRLIRAEEKRRAEPTDSAES
jgi:ribonuclease HI